MNTFNRLLVAILFVCSVAFGQAVTALSNYTSTTTSAAITTTSATQISLTSGTNVTSPGVNQAQGGLGSPTGGPNYTCIYIDRELMRVNTGGASPRVERGFQGTQSSSHLSGATAYISGCSNFITRQYFGSCTRANFSFLPQINTNTGDIYNCPNIGPYASMWEIVGKTGPPGVGATNQDTSSFGTSAVQTCHFQYNFANDGGAVSTITPANNCVLPANSIITGATIYASTAATTSASGTLSIGYSGTGGGVTKLLAATAAASVTGVLQSVIVPQTASGFGRITTAGAGQVAIATGALTAGVVDVWINYIVSPL